MNIEAIVFYLFSALLIGAAFMVVLSNNPVRGVLYLIVSFFATCVLWILLQAEFLALALIFVYVGAVMTLFLFVVMMLNIKQASQREGAAKYFPLAFLVIAIFVGVMFYIFHGKFFENSAFSGLAAKSADYSNVDALGQVLYTDYAYPFEIAGVILLIAIISAIGLAFRGRQNRKSQEIDKQLAAEKADRLKIIKNVSQE